MDVGRRAEGVSVVTVKCWLFLLKDSEVTANKVFRRTKNGIIF